MPDYRQQEGPATAWRRASSITIQNPIAGTGTPSIRFEEDDVAVVNGKKFISRAPFGGVTGAFDPNATIALLDPTTGADTGQTTTQGALYTILYSLYIQLALARDAQATPPSMP